MLLLVAWALSWTQPAADRPATASKTIDMTLIIQLPVGRLSPKRSPYQCQPRNRHHAVEQALEGGDAQPLDDQPRGVSAGHHRAARDQPLDDDIDRHGAEA